MQQSIKRETYAPTKAEQLLWWLATAEKKLLIQSITGKNKYAIIGMCVLSTWLFATAAWIYFFSIITTSTITAIALGLFMGFIILTIDRALIKSISSLNNKKILPLIFRAVLAIAIGTFMAQPALLYLFDKEVKMQVSLDNEQRKKDKATQQEAAISITKNKWLQQKQTLTKTLENKYAEVAAARNNFIAETDGTGGSKKIGLKDIAIAKQKTYEHLQNEYDILNKQLQPQIQQADNALTVIQTNIQKEQQQFEVLLNNGFLTRTEALNNLIKTNTALQFRYYLIIFILVLIELIPVLAKAFLPKTSYEEKLLLHENNELILQKQVYENELKLKQQFNQNVFNNNELINNNFFELTQQKSHEKMQNIIHGFNESYTTQTIWQEVNSNLSLQQQT
ncbi:MAG: DUF4407 domain-containing protein [Bacteroidetes bacterium]|nr:DUF4407 domain-containing protein [Bacteroidota bacterium]MBS1672025.1 DUF4407 domain-containing protein [Bacteroidota bacterium]